VEEDLASHKYAGRVHTRFPPEPNAYLHIGHAKAICTSFGVAADYGGVCNLRFDDTNPSREEAEYVEAMKRDIEWLGFDWGDRLYHASDYFDYLYACAEDLIQKGLAYVDDLSAQEIRQYRARSPSQGSTALPRPLGGGEPRAVSPHAGRRVPRGLARAPRQDRYGVTQHRPA